MYFNSTMICIKTKFLNTFKIRNKVVIINQRNQKPIIKVYTK